MAVLAAVSVLSRVAGRVADIIDPDNWNSKKYTSSCHSSYYYHRHYCFYSGYTTNVSVKIFLGDVVVGL
jgi:hypothetical protein